MSGRTFSNAWFLCASALLSVLTLMLLFGLAPLFCYHVVGFLHCLGRGVHDTPNTMMHGLGTTHIENTELDGTLA